MNILCENSTMQKNIPHMVSQAAPSTNTCTSSSLPQHVGYREKLRCTSPYITTFFQRNFAVSQDAGTKQGRVQLLHAGHAFGYIVHAHVYIMTSYHCRCACGNYSRAQFIRFSLSKESGEGTIQGRGEFKDVRYCICSGAILYTQ